MKQRKKRITALQFDQALLEQIEHAQGMNIPRNALSSAVMFAMLVGNCLFGKRNQSERIPEFNAALGKVIEDARVERAEADLRAREEARRAESQIVLPGQIKGTTN